MRWQALLIAAALALVGADAAGDKAHKDQDAFQGTWVVVTAERDGHKYSTAEAKEMKLVIEGDHFTFAGPNGEEKGVFKLDPDKSPKALDILAESGRNQGKTVLAIYELVGKDRHRACLAPAGKDRPKTFSAKAGSGNTLYEMKHSGVDSEGGKARQRRQGG